RDVLREATFQGYHSICVFKGIKIGIILFVTHHFLINKDILIIITLEIYFLILQLIEYINIPFTIADSIYGSTFFIATGFHGIHVIIRILFLLVRSI
ncbi:COX3 oxidase, partial [Acromyrmex charruanus]